MRTLCLQFLLHTALLLSPAALHAAEDPVELLNSIKQALLDESVDKGVRVVSSGYVDSTGALVESTTYTSALDVSGVRVLSYLQDEDEPAAPAIERLPEGLRSWVRGVCEAQTSPLGRNVSYRLEIQAPGLPELASGGKATLAGLMQKSFSVNPAWTLFADNTRTFGNRYENLLYGRTAAIETDYAMVVTVEQLASARDVPGILPALNSLGRAATAGMQALLQRNPVAEVAPRAGKNPVGLRFRYKLVDLVDAAHSIVHVHHALVEENASALIQASVLDTVADEFGKGLAAWQELLPPATGCGNDPAYLHAGQEPGQLLLLSGTANGVRAHDRFLLLGRKLVQAGALNADWAGELAIGEVESVTEHEARIRPVTDTGAQPADFHYAIRF
jgi:hypothetical protein